MSDVSPPQAGWYQDPENPTGERWWNGSGWSDQKRTSTAAAPVAETTGFRFGGPDPSPGSRPDPYGPPPTYSASQPSAPPTYSPGSPYVAAPYGAPAYGSRTNGLAIAGLIVSAGGWIVLPFVAPIAGIILSAFGLARAKQAETAGNPNNGRGIAMAGLIIGIVVAALGVLFFVLYFGFVLSIGPSL
jgi:hypothetical protein